jgi:hypothetical protein
MKTRSNRISAVQRRAKRRVILIAIGAAAFAGYSAVTLFASDGKQGVVEELNKVPAVRAVGIRLLNPAGEKQQKQIELSLPPSASALPTPSLPSNPITLPPASPSLSASASTSHRNLELLPTPPRMQETVSKTASGKVIVRLASDKKEMPTKNPTQVSSNSQKLPDRGFVELQTMSPTDPSSPVLVLPVPRPRNPELVKPQRFQISEAVILASAPEMDAPLLDEPTANENGPTVEEQDQIAPSPVEIVVSTPKESSLATPVGSSADGLYLPMVPLIAPTSDLAIAEPTDPITEFKEEKSTAKPGTIYDSQWSNVSPVATIEMESQSATALEIPGNVRAVAVESEDVCSVLHTERTISIVGSKQGSSLIQIWTNEIKDAPQVLRVNVSQPWQTPKANPGDLKEVKQALAQAFPRSNLKLLKQEDGTLEVRGTTENEETARRVLEMVRKLCLVPVKDKVTVMR